MKTTAAALRQLFLEYFRGRQHEVVKSSALVPANDPTLMFTNAGMVQFKDVFNGTDKRDYQNATTCQKCLRVSGKHNDLENVGRTARHHTFFEMLGNFSFGGYFKEGAIRHAWTFVTEAAGLPKDSLHVTVYEEDDETYAIWRDVIGVPESRIARAGAKDNFWAMGETGPCGPCSEIHVDRSQGPLPGFGATSGEAAGDRLLEIWNLVFMQFDRDASGKMTPLPRPCIDTGMGLERLLAVLNGAPSNYDTGLFMPVIEYAANLADKRYTGSDAEDDVSLRVIADHARAAAFLVGDGVLPSNEGRGYVLRRIMRRAIRHGARLGLDSLFYAGACDTVIAGMGAAYPELRENRAFILKVVEEEERTFRRTLSRGLELIERNNEWREEAGRRILPGSVAFKLYDTFGFPLDLTQTIGADHGFEVDVAGFDAGMETQRHRSHWKGSGETAVAAVYKELAGKLPETQFTGYERTEDTGKVLAIIQNGKAVEAATTGELEFVADRTPFYAESGGQVGDCGVAEAGGLALEIDDTVKPFGSLFVHRGKLLQGRLAVGDALRLEVNHVRRDAIRAHHSATHLLHHALRRVLGEHVRQAGSYVGPDRLRFDYSHFEQPTPEQLHDIEIEANHLVRANTATATESTTPDAARAQGAIAFFGEKYGDTVRMVRIGGPSLELCGGTHVHHSGDIGLIKIAGDSSIASGVRRLEAVAGDAALRHVQHLEATLARAAAAARASPAELAATIERFHEERKTLTKQIDKLKRQLASGGAAADPMSQVTGVAGIKLLAIQSPVGDPKALRELCDQLKAKLGSGVVVIGAVSEADGKALLVAGVTPDLTARVHAGKLIGKLAEAVGGRGGGRPDFAQAGGPDAAQLGPALELAKTLIG